jgi:spermidine/putrescine transport system permease protein
MSRAKTASWIYVALMVAFLFAPAVVVVLFSFNATSSTSLPFAGFSVRWYRAAFGDDQFVEALENSLKVAFATAAIVAFVGTNAAFALARKRSRVLDAFSAFVSTPLIVPGLFLGVALLSFYDEIGMRRTLLTVIFGHALVTLPFVVLIVNARLARLDRSVDEAARDLGATALQTFWKITFPLVRPALAGSILIAIAWSFDEFIITFFTIGPKITLPILIWGKLRLGVDPSVNAIASVILAATITLTAVAGRFISAREVAR